MNVSWQLVAALKQLQEFMSNFELSFELKGYRPARKVVMVPRRPNESSELKRKRKLHVRYISPCNLVIGYISWFGTSGSRKRFLNCEHGGFTTTSTPARSSWPSQICSDIRNSPSVARTSASSLQTSIARSRSEPLPRTCLLSKCISRYFVATSRF